MQMYWLGIVQGQAVFHVVEEAVVVHCLLNHLHDEGRFVGSCHHSADLAL